MKIKSNLGNSNFIAVITEINTNVSFLIVICSAFISANFFVNFIVHLPNF